MTAMPLTEPDRGGREHRPRLQKILAQAGLASRRAAERLIAEGRVTVNGRIVRDMGVKADPASDDIRVDGRRVRRPEPRRYILLYKPTGVITTRFDPRRRTTVMDLLGGVRESVYPVGRLDCDSEGLLLLTNDGSLALQLTHPRHGIERTYEARVTGAPDARALARLRSGVLLGGRRTAPATVTVIASDPGTRRRHTGGARQESARQETVLRITIREGRNRQVRRMCAAVGHPVRSLRRVRIGPLADARLKPGEWRDLTVRERQALLALTASRRPAPHGEGRAPTRRRT